MSAETLETFPRDFGVPTLIEGLSGVLSFTVFTLAIAGVGDVRMLSLPRFLAGLGLGGAMPSAAALASEYVPRRQGPFAITLTIACIPLCGMLAAFMSARVIPNYGWRALFVAGGIVPIGLEGILFAILPESPRYLARREQRWPELIALLRRIGHEVTSDVQFVDAGMAHTEQPRAAEGKNPSI